MKAAGEDGIQVMRKEQSLRENTGHTLFTPVRAHGTVSGDKSGAREAPGQAEGSRHRKCRGQRTMAYLPGEKKGRIH